MELPVRACYGNSLYLVYRLIPAVRILNLNADFLAVLLQLGSLISADHHVYSLGYLSGDHALCRGLYRIDVNLNNRRGVLQGGVNLCQLRSLL